MDLGRYRGFWVRGLIAKLLKKVEILPYFLFWGWSYAGKSSLSTIGGSLNSICLFAHSFQFSLGSTTGSLYIFLYLFKKSGTFSTAISFCRCSRNKGQLTYRQLYFFAKSSYSSADLIFSLVLSQMRVAISQYPGRMANSRVVRPQGVKNLQSAPCSSKYLTTLIWFLFTAAMRGVYPLSVGWLTEASHCSTKKAMVSISPLQAVRYRGVILVFSVSL